MASLRAMAVAVGILLTLAVPARAENWPQWRGPNFDGSSPEANLPATWSTADGVRWAAPLPGPGSATPAIWGDRVFVSSTDTATSGVLAMCLSAADGKVLWKHRVGDDAKAPRNNMASPSPVTDGRRAFFLYGNGLLAAFEADGRAAWTRDLVKDFGNPATKYGYSSSPVLYKGKLYVVFLRRPTAYYPPEETRPALDSYLLAIDPATGKDLWRTVRPTEAVDESHESYATPLPLEGAGRSEILLIGGDYATGHDPETGRELWRWCYNPEHVERQRLIPSMVAGDGLIFFAVLRGKATIALKPGGSGLRGPEAVAWKFDGQGTDSPTPLYYKGVVYLPDADGRNLTALDAKTGTLKWKGRLGAAGPVRGSPTGADGRIYTLAENGDVFVIDAGPEFKVQARIPMGGGPNCSTVAVAAGRLYIRTGTTLYCVGK